MLPRRRTQLSRAAGPGRRTRSPRSPSDTRSTSPRTAACSGRRRISRRPAARRYRRLHSPSGRTWPFRRTAACTGHPRTSRRPASSSCRSLRSPSDTWSRSHRTAACSARRRISRRRTRTSPSASRTRPPRPARPQGRPAATSSPPAVRQPMHRPAGFPYRLHELLLLSIDQGSGGDPDADHRRWARAGCEPGAPGPTAGTVLRASIASTPGLAFVIQFAQGQPFTRAVAT